MTASHELKTRSSIHLARKIWHFLGVIFILVCYHNMSRVMALQLFTFFTVIFVFIDFYRQRSEKLNKFVMLVMHPVMRDSEKNNLAGSTYLLAGVLTVIILFPQSVVVLSLLFLAVADPIASYFGIRYGKDRLIGRKSLQGTMAAFFACTTVAAGYFLNHNMMTERILIVSLLAGLIGAISEVIPIGKLDDNLVIPVVSASLLWGGVLFFWGLLMYDFDKEVKMSATTGKSEQQNLRQLNKKRRLRDRLHVNIYVLPNLLTTINMFFGFYAVIHAIMGEYLMAAYAIVAAAVFDLLDGRVARMTRSTSEFGAQLDSLLVS